MNQEIAEFFVKFTSEGLADVKSAVDDLSKKMDDVAKSTQRATDKSDGFFANIGKGGKWLIALTGFTSAVMLLRTAWNNVADAAASTMNIYNQAMLAGTDPKTLERWQNVARHKGLNSGEIFSDFRSGRDLLKQFEYVEISDEFNKVFGRVGILSASDAIINSLMAGNLNEVFSILNEKLSATGKDGNFLIDSADADRIMKQLGFGDTMLSLLRIKELSTLLENANTIYTKDPETLRASAEYTEAKETLKDSWKSIWADPNIIKDATKLLNYLNDTVMPELKSFFSWLFDKIGDILITSGETADEKAAGNALKVAAGTVGALVGGVAGAGAGVVAADKAHDYLLKKNWYKNLVNKSAPEGFWSDYNNQYQTMLMAADAGSMPTFSEIQGGNASATAIVNLNDVEIVRKTGDGYTEVSMSLPTPSSTR